MDNQPMDTETKKPLKTVAKRKIAVRMKRLTRAVTAAPMTTGLLVVMFTVALTLGLASYTLGREALKGINQLDIQATKRSKAVKANAQDGAVQFLNEKELITNVRTRIRGEVKSGKAKPPKN
jgi:hypothetical protein